MSFRICLLLLLPWLACAGRPALAQTVDEQLSSQSLPLRTALHYDPTLKAPLDRLITLYREANKVQELVDLYRAHLKSYPQDARAQTVLIRLLEATGDPSVAQAVRLATQQFPNDAYLHYLHYQALRKRNDAQALDHLDKAIELEMLPARKAAWIDALLPAAEVEGRRDLAEKHLRAMADGTSEPDAMLDIARKMNKFKFHEMALATLTKPPARPPAPEVMVSMQLEAANAEMGLNKSTQAGARLDSLLEKLTADYWRRGEIVSRRLALVSSEEERQNMVAAARQRVTDNPADEAAVLDLAQVQVGLQFRRDALQSLLEGAERIPQSELIEQRALELFDRLRDEHGREQFLAARLRQQPDRSDLTLQYVKTLFLLGRKNDARTQWDAALAGLSKTDQAAQHLEMARFLRRSSLARYAADLFQRVLELDPARVDVRRELGETYLALGQRDKIRGLFEEQLPEQATLENVFDLAQFMIAQELFAEARSALRGRLERHATNLDIRGLLLTIERRLGNRVAGAALIEQSRPLADTGSRYRKWLESAVDFHEQFDSQDKFLEQELNQLEQEDSKWTERRLERRLAFADTAATLGVIEPAVAMLQTDLNSNPPREYRIAIRRQLIAALEKGRSQVAVVQKHLADLAAEEPLLADEANARRALLHVSMQRVDLAMPLIEKVDVQQINDTTVLRGMETLLTQHGGDRKKILAILQRLTALDPTDRGAWENWISALAATGDEARLRRVIRQLLAGVDKMPLADESTALLENHLADSYWRSIVRQLADSSEAALAEALVQLDSVEQMSSQLDRSLWIAWIRAHILNQQARPAVRDEAIHEMERLVTEGIPGTGHIAADPREITFPDGLTISLGHARSMLSSNDPPAGNEIEMPERQGSLPPFEVQWVFESDTGATVQAAIPLDNQRILICESSGDAFCLDRASGKLLWQRDDLLPTVNVTQTVNVPVGGYQGGYKQVQRSVSHLSARPLVEDEGRFFVPTEADVSCYQASTGNFLWRVKTGHAMQSSAAKTQGSVATRVFLFEGSLLTYNVFSGAMARVDPGNGKVVWEKQLEIDPQVSVTDDNSGASLSAHRLLVYGRKTAIVDLNSGEIQWSIDPKRVREFPIELNEPDQAGRDAGWPSGIPSYYAPYGAGQTGNAPGYSRSATMQQRSYPAYPGYAMPNQAPQYLNYLSPSNASGAVPRGAIRVAPPAVVWASQTAGTKSAHLVGGKLLLLGGNTLQMIHTDLPLSSHRIENVGRLLAMTGYIACFGEPTGVRFVDLRNGAVRQFELPQAKAAEQGFQLLADGPLVYITGPHGLLAVNALTARRVFQLPWPADVAGDVVTPTVAANTGQVYETRGQLATKWSSVGCADGGVIYALASPTRLVALRGQTANDQ